MHKRSEWMWNSQHNPNTHKMPTTKNDLQTAQQTQCHSHQTMPHTASPMAIKGHQHCYQTVAQTRLKSAITCIHNHMCQPHNQWHTKRRQNVCKQDVLETMHTLPPESKSLPQQAQCTSNKLPANMCGILDALSKKPAA